MDNKQSVDQMEGSNINESLWSATLPNAPQLPPNANTPKSLDYLWSNIATFVSVELEPGNSTSPGFANWLGTRGLTQGATSEPIMPDLGGKLF